MKRKVVTDLEEILNLFGNFNNTTNKVYFSLDEGSSGGATTFGWAPIGIYFDINTEEFQIVGSWNKESKEIIPIKLVTDTCTAKIVYSGWTDNREWDEYLSIIVLTLDNGKQIEHKFDSDSGEYFNFAKLLLEYKNYWEILKKEYSIEHIKKRLKEIARINTIKAVTVGILTVLVIILFIAGIAHVS